MDDRFHYPPDVFNLLVDTIPLLCKGKEDVLLFLRGAGVPNEDVAEMQVKVRADRKSISKFAIVRDVLEKLNKRGDAGLGPRREIIKRVVEFEHFSMCWENDVHKAKANVGDLARIVNHRDSFTRMNQQREAAQAEVAAKARAEREVAAEKSRKILDVRDRLNALFGMDAEPQKRGKQLEGVLNDLFRAYGILVREDFKRQAPAGSLIVEQIDGVVEFEGHIYLVEMKWISTPVGVSDLGSHMMRLFAREGVRGLFISNSDFTASAIAECVTHSNNKTMALCTLREIVMLLLDERDLIALLRSKVRAAILDKKPFHEILR
ncbi:restriction endonuclease [Rhodoferax sp. U2-2l]|uniref:restriction endonuclease n=1 Tax=Rhodoferax sp. U2-2l TaxID=2884000 RepID=UPI001D09F5F0|nr:restriction endonuclease [Rhodoferax sp. U2-2l]MCB8748254.1 restriction endonuclease [Rhodoferax sp. U2-2l]